MLFKRFDTQHNKNELVQNRSMLRTVWIICILFDEKFKAKINAKFFCFKIFVFFMVYLS